MVRKHLPTPEQDQGMLFEEKTLHSGVTDPAMQKITTEFTPAPEGVFPETPKEPGNPFSNPEMVEMVHKAVIKENRSRAQRGKHSPLQASGGEGYSKHLQAGDYLPDFGPVTYSNLKQASKHAQALDEQLKNKTIE